MDPQQGASPDQIIGQTVGNYLVTQKLGEGGMGSVYLAEHPSIGKKVALKILHAEFSSNPEVAERFFTEAKAVNAIGHPNIVDIVDYGVLQTGPGGRDRLVYFIMEYLNGPALANVLRNESPLTPERALTIALQVADALAASHKTRTGLVLGTPAYMSPEQCEGRASVDHRTDIYALGVVLYEMLTGRVPFIGEGYGEILVQHLTQQPVPPSQFRMMSPHVEQVVLKALEKRPEMRYPTMDEFIRAMSDPVGYVESHGGVGGFLARQLMPSSAPLPAAVRLTPAPMTPVPGLMSPVPGTLNTGMVGPTPTTLSSAAGAAGVAPTKSKTPFIIAAGLVVALTGAGVFMVLNKKSSTTAAQNGSDGSAETMVDKGSDKGSAVVQTPPPPVTPDAAVAVAPPDAAVQVVEHETGSGSAAGSAATPAATLSLAINSVPPGADIYVNSAPTNKKTPNTLSLPPGEYKITLRNKGFDDFRKTVSLKSDQKVDAALKKYVPPSGQGSGKGKGSGTKQCDTCLERPD